jgi:hypothetical protein
MVFLVVKLAAMVLCCNMLATEDIFTTALQGQETQFLSADTATIGWHDIQFYLSGFVSDWVLLSIFKAVAA